jgi:hypothetical protein
MNFFLILIFILFACCNQERKKHIAVKEDIDASITSTVDTFYTEMPLENDTLIQDSQYVQKAFDDINFGIFQLNPKFRQNGSDVYRINSIRFVMQGGRVDEKMGLYQFRLVHRGNRDTRTGVNQILYEITQPITTKYGFPIEINQYIPPDGGAYNVWIASALVPELAEITETLKEAMKDEGEGTVMYEWVTPIKKIQLGFYKSYELPDLEALKNEDAATIKRRFLQGLTKRYDIYIEFTSRKIKDLLDSMEVTEKQQTREEDIDKF